MQQQLRMHMQSDACACMHAWYMCIAAVLPDAGTVTECLTARPECCCVLTTNAKAIRHTKMKGQRNIASCVAMPVM